MHVEQAAPQPIDRPLSALECYESRGWPNMLKANIEASEFPLSAPLPTAAWTRASPIQVDAALSPLKKEPPVGGPERMKEA
jgi:hypothetical protein